MHKNEVQGAQRIPATASPLARLSLERKLPLLMAALLLAVTGAVTGAAYMEVRLAATSAAASRLGSVTDQFRSLFQQSATQLRTQSVLAAANREVAAFARTRASRDADAAVRALSQNLVQPAQVLTTQIRDSSDAVILQTSAGHAELDAFTTRDLIARARTDSAAIGRFRLVNDSIVYPVVAHVKGTPLYVVRWRVLSGTRRSREQITSLVGSDASLLLGNSDGSTWSNLERSVPGPGAGDTRNGSVHGYARPDGSRALLSVAGIPQTPWSVAVDFPLAGILAPTQRFLARMAAVGLMALALGLLAAWIASRRITEPLAQLTKAADSLATGDHTRRVEIARADEIGRLAAAFNSMAREVGRSRDDLEHVVAERTRELNATLRQLHDAQDSLVRREKLAILGQLSSGVGHELRNPLGVMTNAVYFLRMILRDSPANVHEYLGILQQQITLSEKIVTDLLDFARSKPPQRKPSSVSEITRAQLARLGAPSGLEIESRVPEQLPNVLVDEVQIGQIVLNLLTNAMQAMDGKGRITISAAVENGQVLYEVGDSGPGIPAENVEKIFEPLFTTKARGIGLGLAVSRTLARANQGDLTVNSVAGAGATFRLTLPLARAA